MALLNPVYAFVVPFLFVVTVPLAVFAGITTTIAFSVLILRVLAVYIDVALSFVPHYLGGRKIRPYHPNNYRPHHHVLDSSASRTLYTNPSPPSAGSTAFESSLRRRRHRRSSSALSTAGSTTPISEKTFGLVPSIGPERDFEGIGGWRLGGDDETWTTINSRLELPDKQHLGRNHHRSPSGGPTTPGEGGYLMMKGRTRSPGTKISSASPNSSRTRTPSGPRIAFTNKSFVDSYFPNLKTSPKGLKRLPTQGLVDA
ncbi:hypothetical protein FSARC_6063 [Fusarium sarcochroum]|uniref:Uncharacterized protein n=1 Tax=Fusarium sarcochroum TaxID=1208366 RepID=A0A8H4TY95_9HYPO|nr:hypothetical protein FSARC_6063 [Fusarium sarcochroum]